MISFNTEKLIRKYYIVAPGLIPLAITRIIYDWFCVLYFEKNVQKSFIILTSFAKGIFSDYLKD